MSPRAGALPVELGSAIIGLVDPHPGHERAFHHWYERDHLYSAAAAAPGTLSVALWLAPPELRALRMPRDNPITGDADRGTHLSTIWIQHGRLDEQTAWTDAEMKRQRAEPGRLFPQRDHLYTHRYRYCGAARRAANGVPPEVALDRGYAGIVASWVVKPPEQNLDDFECALRERFLPDRLSGSPIELAVVLALRPKPASWPDDFPEPPGLGERLLVLWFLEVDPREAWAIHFESLGADLARGGFGELLLAAPFLRSIPGTDRHVEALRESGPA